MSSLTTLFGSSGSSGGCKIKRQEFTASGVFTPSSALLALGGFVRVTLIGGGGTGGTGTYVATYSQFAPGAGGSSGATVIIELSLTGSITVTIGAAGGNSTFGSFAIAKGGKQGTAGFYIASDSYKPTPGGTAVGFPGFSASGADSVAFPGGTYGGEGGATYGNRNQGGAGSTAKGAYTTTQPASHKGQAGSRGSGGGGSSPWYYYDELDPEGAYPVNVTGGTGGSGYCLVEWLE